MKDGMQVLRDFGGMAKAEIDKIKAWFRSTFLGRLIWAIRNRNVDFASKPDPKIEFGLTTEQAEYCRQVMCIEDLRFDGGMARFYQKYPRHTFNLPPYSPDPYMKRVEAGQLALAAARIVTPPTVEGGKEMFARDSDFVKMLARMGREIEDKLDEAKESMGRG